MKDIAQITVLGIGNILLKDEGIGVRVAQHLQSEYRFPENIAVVDGGVTGLLGLVPLIEDTDHLIVIDAIHGDAPPGTLYRYELPDFRLTLPKKLSMHDVGFIECMTVLEINDKLPKTTVIVGVQPADFTSVKIGLSDVIRDSLLPITKDVLKELSALGAHPVSLEK